MHKYIIGMKFSSLLIISILCLYAASLYAKNRVDIVAENAPAVVAVNVLKDDGTTFTGTGFVLTPDGVIATTRHHLDHAAAVNLTFNTGAVSGQAITLSADEKTDIALLKIAARDLPTVQLADSDYVLPGQDITVIGNPRRLQNTVSSGLISQVRKQTDGTLWHQISAPISPSSSGSPVFNEDGQVIAMAFATYPGDGNQNLNFAIPSNYISQQLHQAGYPAIAFIAQPTPPTLWERFVQHVKLSWQSLCNLFTAQR